MRRIFYVFWLSILLAANPLRAAEQASLEVEQTQPESETNVQRMAEIASPLLSDDYNRPHVSINALGYVPSKHLYPVRVISINKFKIKPLLHGYQYRLPGGTYVLEVSPDFSLLNQVERFMNDSFASQRVEISLSNRSSYVLGARINPEDTEQWRLEVLELGDVVATE